MRRFDSFMRTILCCWPCRKKGVGVDACVNQTEMQPIATPPITSPKVSPFSQPVALETVPAAHPLQLESAPVGMQQEQRLLPEDPKPLLPAPLDPVQVSTTTAREPPRPGAVQELYPIGLARHVMEMPGVDDLDVSNSDDSADEAPPGSRGGSSSSGRRSARSASGPSAKAGGSLRDRIGMLHMSCNENGSGKGCSNSGSGGQSRRGGGGSWPSLSSGSGKGKKKSTTGGRRDKRSSRSSAGHSEEELARRAELRRIMHRRIQDELRSEERLGSETSSDGGGVAKVESAKGSLRRITELPGGGPRDAIEFAVDEKEVDTVKSLPLTEPVMPGLGPGSAPEQSNNSSSDHLLQTTSGSSSGQNVHLKEKAVGSKNALGFVPDNASSSLNDSLSMRHLNDLSAAATANKVSSTSSLPLQRLPPELPNTPSDNEESVVETWLLTQQLVTEDERENPNVKTPPVSMPGPSSPPPPPPHLPPMVMSGQREVEMGRRPEHRYKMAGSADSLDGFLDLGYDVARTMFDGQDEEHGLSSNIGEETKREREHSSTSVGERFWTPDSQQTRSCVTTSVNDSDSDLGNTRTKDKATDKSASRASTSPAHTVEEQSGGQEKSNGGADNAPVGA